MKLSITILCLFLASCTPQKRLARLLDKHPYLIEQRDTVRTIERIEVAAEVKTDTVFRTVAGKRDTLIIETKRSITNIYTNEDKSEISVDQTIHADSTDQVTNTITNTLDTSEQKMERIGLKIFFALLILMVVYFLGNVLVERSKRI